jgi:hypothetical protein
MSAYLLFNTKAGAVLNTENQVSRFDTGFSFESQLDRSLINEIERDNDKYLKMQSIFRYEMIVLIETIVDLECLLLYFVNVFCHSDLGVYQQVIRKILDDMLFANSIHPAFVVDFCRNHFAALEDIFLN